LLFVEACNYFSNSNLTCPLKLYSEIIFWILILLLKTFYITQSKTYFNYTLNNS